jgi:hypothetical protein
VKFFSFVLDGFEWGDRGPLGSFLNEKRGVGRSGWGFGGEVVGPFWGFMRIGGRGQALLLRKQMHSK